MIVVFGNNGQVKLLNSGRLMRLLYGRDQYQIRERAILENAYPDHRSPGKAYFTLEWVDEYVQPILSEKYNRMRYLSYEFGWHLHMLGIMTCRRVSGGRGSVAFVRIRFIHCGRQPPQFCMRQGGSCSCPRDCGA